MEMTVSHGYPDYSRVSGYADQIFLAGTQAPTTDGWSSDLLYVGNYNALGFLFSPRTAAAMVQLAYYSAKDYSFTVAKQTAHVAAGGVYKGSAVPLGPYLQVTMKSAAASDIADVYLFSAFGKATYDETGYDSLLISQTDVAVAANGQTDFLATATWPTEAAWTVGASATSWIADLYGIDYQGGSHLIDRAYADQGPRVSRKVYLPPMPMVVRVFNFDAAAATADVFLSAQPSIIT